jgi:hypothetical protein
MKVTKTSVHRLTIEKTCGCAATREYEDLRYAKPIADGKFVPCDKHEKNKLLAEFAGEMLLEMLDKEAAEAGKAVFAPAQRQVAEGDNGGVQAPGAESVQAMGMTMPKMRERPADPLAIKTRTRPTPTGPRPQNTALTGSLNAAQPLTDEEIEEEGITITGSIEDVEADPRIDTLVQESLNNESGLLDSDEPDV